MNNNRLHTAVFLLIVGFALAALYATGLQNELVFDDARLTDGTVFGPFGQLFPLRARLLSFGSFVWMKSVFGDGWVAQRALNICIHVLTTLALYALLLKLVSHAIDQAPNKAPHPSAAHSLAAVRMATILWAFNPVAVYAVAYLIQRSILMATLGVVVSLLAFVRALETKQFKWLGATLIGYAFAVLSKEHAAAMPLVLIPIFVYWNRPAMRTVLGVVGGSVLAMAVAIGLLWQQYGYLIGTTFDDASLAMALQLEQLQPDIRPLLYPLSIVNQAWLFFQYGLFWVIPNVGGMQLDIRPAFPLELLAWPQIAGPFGYVFLLVTGIWLVIKHKGLLALAGVGLLIPLLLFLTEFATVWIQDPFVLYRSYLWSIGFAILVMLAFTCIPSQKVIYGFGVGCALVFAALGFERIDSLHSPRSAWTDALNKTDLKAPASAVGRWRPALNLSQEALLRGNADTALSYARQAMQLGEPMGLAQFNAGGALRASKKPVEAIEALNSAEKLGYNSFELHFQRGELLMTVDRFQAAHGDLEQALRQAPNPAMRFEALKLAAEAANQAKMYPLAVGYFEELHQQSPTVLPYILSLAYAHFSMGNRVAALAVLDNALAKAPTGLLYHARAQVWAHQGQKQAALADITKALAAEPQNSTYLQFKRQLEGARP